MISGGRLRVALRAAGMTQGELAGAVGVSPAAVSRYANGRRSPDGGTLRAIAGVLGVMPEWLVAPVADPAELAVEVLLTARDMERDAEGLRDECPRAADALRGYSQHLMALFGEDE